MEGGGGGKRLGVILKQLHGTVLVSFKPVRHLNVYNNTNDHITSLMTIVTVFHEQFILVLTVFMELLNFQLMEFCCSFLIRSQKIGQGHKIIKKNMVTIQPTSRVVA